MYAHPARCAALNYKCAGRERHNYAGLDYFAARCLNARAGRFTTVDSLAWRPIGVGGGASVAIIWQAPVGLETDGGTSCSLAVTIPTVPADHWKAEYFGNTTVSGTPAATVDEGTGFVDHSWGDGGPAGLADHFSAGFTRTVTLAAGRYRFSVTTDDGSRLWVDEQLRINQWWPSELVDSCKNGCQSSTSRNLLGCDHAGTGRES
jgi:hypothetical protein